MVWSNNPCHHLLFITKLSHLFKSFYINFPIFQLTILLYNFSIQLFTSFFLILNYLSYKIKMIYFFVGFYCFFGLFCILTTFKHRFEMKKPASALADAGHLSG